ncbi:MAG: hypothetical protein ACREXS_12695 [Gammaproteobacteria bacterium]
MEHDSAKNIYAAVADLIKTLDAAGHHRIANVLEHRMYKVGWTSSSELLEELAKVLRNFLSETEPALDDQSIEKAQHTLRTIETELRE